MTDAFEFVRVTSLAGLRVLEDGLAMVSDDLHTLFCDVRRRVDIDHDATMSSIEARLRNALGEIDRLADNAETVLAMIEPDDDGGEL